MAARLTIRPLMCVVLVLLLGVQVLASTAPAGQRDGAAQFRGMAVLSPTVLLTRGSTGYDHARQRPSAASLFTLVPRHGNECDPGRPTGAVERHVRHSLWIAGPRTGRSPPVIS
jgi:hypothetical protein